MADGNILSFWGHKRQLSLVMQSESAECALACLAMIARYHGHDSTLASLRRRFTTSLRGMHLGRVIEIAHALEFEARPLRAELDYLPNAQLPCILHWDMKHFVVLSRVFRKEVEIFDPARGHYRMPIEEASKHFTGILVELIPGVNFKPIKEKQRIRLRTLTGHVSGLTRAMFQVTGLAFAIEVIALVIPFQMQWTLDQVLVANDRNLLVVLTIGFVMLIGVSSLLGMARAWVTSWLGATLNAQWVTNLFSHLLKLPLDYFEKRHMGDIMSRFYSVQSIQNTITGSFVEVVLDGVMGTLALVIVFIYSASMTIVVLGALLIYALMRWGMYRTLWSLNEEQMVYTATQQTEIMESLRGVQAIKLANKQSERKSRLSNATLEVAKRMMRNQRILLAFGVVNQNLFGLQRVVLIAIGTYLAMRGRFSAGMLVAYIAYTDQLGIKFGSLVDKFVEFGMLRLHAERIADIALAEPERFAQGTYSGPELAPRIEVKKLSFRYADGEPWVLRNLNLSFEVGESVAVVGPSGFGKSTLAKLLVGLLEPTEGTIEVSGVDIRKYGLENYRRLIGAVMQDDTLFAGSIADNISLFDTAADFEEVVLAAHTAEMHQEISAMPMGYESAVGDMGSVLSGGQKQRLTLARALYKKPKILVLDEATSHLDQAKEKVINERIKQLRMTRIIMAHRTETIASADRVVDLTTLMDQSDLAVPRAS